MIQFLSKLVGGTSCQPQVPSLDQEEWFDLMVRSLTLSGLKSARGDVLPDFPEASLQYNTTGLDGVAALRQAFCFYQDVINGIVDSGGCLAQRDRVLDFGVGWGRISRFFLNDVALKNIYGIDVDPEFVSLCKSLFKSKNFHLCEPLPPTRLKPNSFDLITAYSVYSHLSEEACTAWLGEFARLLKPGGYFAFTTRHESFFSYLELLRDNREQYEGYSRALGELFPDINEARSSYARGELVHSSSKGVCGGGVRDESFYGETFIPVEYVERHFTENFEIVSHAFDSNRYDQALYLMRKR